MFVADFFFLRLRKPRPARPLPKRSKVPGSGTTDVVVVENDTVTASVLFCVEKVSKPSVSSNPAAEIVPSALNAL